MPRSAVLLAAMMLAGAAAPAQDELRLSRLPGTVRMVEAEREALDSTRPLAEIGCRVDPFKPFLGFDLAYHAPFRVQLPLKDLAGAGRLRILMRVTPLRRPENQAFLVQRVNVPPVEPEAGGQASLTGTFLVGPGDYRVDWVLRDGRSRACSAHWRLDVRHGDKNVTPAIAADTVTQRSAAPFEEPRGARREPPRGPLRVKILVNFSPAERRRASVLRPTDVEPLVAILRQVASEPQFGLFSLAAFNMNEQRVIYRQDYAERLDLRELGRAVSGVSLATVDFRQLQDPLSATHFLTDLLREELGPQDPAPDAIIIVGPKVLLEKRPPADALKRAGLNPSPVFYFNYNPNPRRTPWRDAIGSVLKLYHGLEYAIFQPRDVGVALSDVRKRLADGRQMHARSD